ncbi:BTB/POZ fold protein [Metarhizium album ARSEF 1941]|uniref:BTB/POZ fold protein n=1 Tax=Metarhizium album (strain ARSEF 1941) TaxID=1081103 RepID=A0A0B2X6L3_METAS|nr:BTB/POZ fold protein [Metarhizium album ARSEF 1941]KHO02034.1 BTB/POZ fold protein [Metarhizium album ARSEF 1941]
MPTTQALPLDPENCAVAWIAPLEIEAQAALHLLDERHRGRFPVGRGDDYVFHAGRTSIRNTLEEKFFAKDQSQKMALVGLGGVGKTQIALRFAYQMKEKRKWLFIVDNADDQDLVFASADKPGLEEYFPKSENGLILSTTRSRQVAAEFAQSHVIDVEQMNGVKMGDGSMDAVGTSIHQDSEGANWPADAEVVAVTFMVDLWEDTDVHFTCFGRQALKYESNPWEQVVHISVGDARNKRAFNVHLKLLVSSSEYFRRSQSGRWAESDTRELCLEEQDPEVFHTYINWLYSRAVNSKCETDLGDTFLSLAKAWILGDYLQDAAFQNDAMTKMYREVRALHRWRSGWDGKTLPMAWVYEHTPVGSLLRAFLVDAFPCYSDCLDMLDSEDPVWTEIQRDIFKALGQKMRKYSLVMKGRWPERRFKAFIRGPTRPCKHYLVQA